MILWPICDERKKKCDERSTLSVKLKSMVEKLADNIADQIDAQLQLSDADREYLFRGILVVLCDAADFFPIIVLSFILNTTGTVAFYILLSSALRHYFGGLHAKTLPKCVCTGLIIYYACMVFAQLINQMFIVSGFGVASFCFLAKESRKGKTFRQTIKLKLNVPGLSGKTILLLILPFMMAILSLYDRIFLRIAVYLLTITAIQVLLQKEGINK